MYCIIRERHVKLKACARTRARVASLPRPRVLFDEWYTVHIEVGITVHR